jgi:phenol hydroxylase P5 protein
MELARRHRSFTYIPALSHEPAISPWPGYRGLAPDAARAAFNGDFRGLNAYLCGPPGMIEACIRTLMQGRLFEKDIYAEKFISAADAPATRSPLFRKL